MSDSNPLINFFWPQRHSENDPEKIAATHMFVSTSFIGMAGSFGLTLCFLFQGYQLLSILTFLFFISILFSILVRRWTENYKIAIHLQVTALYFYLVSLMYFSGGIISPAVMWLPLIIYYVYPLNGKNWTLFWVVVWSVTNLVFFIFGKMGWIQPTLMTASDQLIYTSFSVIFMLPLGLWLYSIYRNSLSLLKESNQKYRFESSHLLQVITHDLRAPLQIIQSYAQLLRDDTGPRKKDFISNIEKAVQRMTTLLNQVREYENLKNIKKPLPLEPVDLKEVIEENLDHLKEQFAQKMIEVKLDFKEPEYLVLAERGALSEHVLCNLIRNAFKFSHPQSVIEISAQKNMNHIVLSIRDHGIGMSEELISQVFEFSKVSSRSGTAGEKGSGFGLPIAKMFLDKMGTGLDLKSYPEESSPKDRGTHFTLTFKKAII